jgi:hypothetical protein
MGNDVLKMKEKPVSTERVSVIDEFGLADLLPGGVKGGVAFEVRTMESKESMGEGDVSIIYTSLLQGMHTVRNKAPENFTYLAVREYYGL